jgi:hypothetical protein
MTRRCEQCGRPIRILKTNWKKPCPWCGAKQTGDYPKKQTGDYPKKSKDASS